MTHKIEKLNELLGREQGRRTNGEPIFRWLHLPSLTYRRWKEWAWNLRQGDGAQLWVPESKFESKQAFPWLGDRWALCKWQEVTESSWTQTFGSRSIFPLNGGYYFPTDVIMKPGFEPDEDVTRFWIGQINLTRSKSAADYEDMLETEQKREERHTFNTVHDAVLDACTAFGNDPGKRSGGISFGGVSLPSVAPKS